MIIGNYKYELSDRLKINLIYPIPNLAPPKLLREGEGGVN